MHPDQCELLRESTQPKARLHALGCQRLWPLL